MTTTPEPAVSPAPDTEALRQQVEELRDLIHEAAVRGIKDWDRDYDSRAAGPVTDYVLGVLHFVLGKREAGLRADLGRARAERDAARADVSHRSTVIAHLQLQNEVLQRRVSDARPIPDDAAERLTYALFRMAPGPFRNAPAAPLHALMAPLWKHTWRSLSDDERAEWLEYGRGVLDQLGFATPTTGPAPAAADGEAPADLLGPAARKDTAPPDAVVHDVTILADQHPDYFAARCTPCGFIAGDFDEQWVQDRADAHRADTLRPSGPLAPVTPANPTPEEKQ